MIPPNHGCKPTVLVLPALATFHRGTLVNSVCLTLDLPASQYVFMQGAVVSAKASPIGVTSAIEAALERYRHPDGATFTTAVSALID